MNIVLQLLLKYFNEEKYTVIMVVVLLVIIHTLQTNAISIISSNIIESIEQNNYGVVFQYYKYYLGVSFIFLILMGIDELLQIRILTKLTPWLRTEFFKLILRSNNEDLTQDNVIKYSSPMNRVSYAATMLVHNLLSNMLTNGTFVVIISAYFLYKDITLGLVFFIANIILVGFIGMNWEGMMEYKNASEQNLNENEVRVVDLFNNFDKIITRGQTEKEIEEYSVRANDCIASSVKFHLYSSKQYFIMTTFIYTIIFCAIYYLIRLKQTNEIDTKTFIAFFTILLLYRDKLTNVLSLIPGMMEFHGRVNMAVKQFDTISAKYAETSHVKQYKDVKLPFNKIEYVGVSYKYNSAENPLFKDFNLTLDTKDKVVGITGLSGKGKSTVMKLLLKLYDTSDGNIYIDGVNIRDINPNYIRENITYVNQSSRLLDRSVVNNLMYGCQDSEKCKEYLDIILKYPAVQNLYKNVDLENKSAGSLGESLSGGQRQIVNILSGLINPSPILILDEPTNALDLGLKKELLGILDDFRKYKKCIIIITHDRDVYHLFDERITM